MVATQPLPLTKTSKDDPKLPPEASFVEFEAGKLHRAFSVPADYDEIQNRFVPPNTSRRKRNIDVDLSDLKKAMGEYRNSLSDVERQRCILKGDSDTCTWDDVFKQLDESRAQYEDRDKEGVGILRRFWHKAGEKADKIDPWLQLIPDQMGLATVRAGLAVALSLARTSVEQRDQLLNGILDIIHTVTVTMSKRRIFQPDDTLDDCCHKLYVAVLEAVATIIQYLLQKTEKRSMGDRVKNPFKDKGSTTRQPKKTMRHIELAIENVKLKARDFVELCDDLKDEILVEGHTMQAATLENTTVIRKKIDSTAQTVRTEAQSTRNAFSQGAEQLNGSLMGVNNQLQQYGNQIEQHGSQLDDITGQLAALPQAIGIEARNFLTRFLETYERRIDNLERRQLLPPVDGISLRSRTPTPRLAPLLSLEDLLTLLSIPLHLPNTDLERITTHSSWFDQQTLSAAQSLLATPQFRHWFAGDGSSLLLADGNDTEHAISYPSSMSLLAVSIMASLLESSRQQTQGSRTIIHFFCGLHDEDEEGPRFMLRSLILQLLLALRARRTLDLSFICTDSYVYDLQKGNLECLFDTFRQLLRQFPVQGTVYILLDGVDKYERDGGGFWGDWVVVLQEMRDIVRERQVSGLSYYAPGSEGGWGKVNGSEVKVLLTSANGSDSRDLVDGHSQYVALGSGVFSPGVFAGFNTVLSGGLGAVDERPWDEGW